MGNQRAPRTGRAAPVAPVARLARFAGATLTDPAIFGDGAARAYVGLRVRAVAYGYLGVVEGYVQPDTGTRMSRVPLNFGGGLHDRQAAITGSS